MATQSVQGLVNNGAGAVSNAPLTNDSPLPIHKGGTGASTVTDVLENLGLSAGVLASVQDDTEPELGGNLDCSGYDVDNVGYLGFDDGSNIVVGTTTGTKIGTAVSQKIGFYNATPIVQRSSADQAAVVATAATDSTPFGYSEAQANAIVTLLNEIRTTLVNLGLMKGSA